MDSWKPLVRALDDVPAGSVTPPEGGRLGAVLALIADPDGDGDLELVYTRRRDDLSTHPGQVSFPGGRVEPGETVEQAALREAAEEIALDPQSVRILGRLPAFYIPPSRFWLQPVVARWEAPHDLVAAQGEVAAVLRVRLSTLRDQAVLRVVRLPPVGLSWAWQLDQRHLLWGATAVVTATLVAMIDPHWHGGADMSALAVEREVRPWETPSRGSPARRPALLRGVEERSVATVQVGVAGDPATTRTMRAAGRAVAGAVVRMAGTGPVLVLAGGGGDGAVGLLAARRLREAGRDVRVVLDRPTGRLSPRAAAALPPVADLVRTFDGALPEAGVVVDALVGRGLSGALTGTARDMALALRHHASPVLAVDLPSGLDPVEGLVGECLPADVTVALGGLRPGLLLPGLGPYVGDLYLACLQRDGALVRLVPDAPAPRRQA